MKALLTAFGTGFALTLGLCAWMPFGLGGWEPTGAYRVPADSMWVAEYHAAERCTGKKGKVKRVTWSLVPGKSFQNQDGDSDIGLWVKDGRHIYIAEAWRNVAWVARHEAIHDLVGPHPADTAKNTRVWGEQCRAMWGWLESDDPEYRP